MSALALERVLLEKGDTSNEEHPRVGSDEHSSDEEPTEAEGLRKRKSKGDNSLTAHGDGDGVKQDVTTRDTEQHKRILRDDSNGGSISILGFALTTMHWAVGIVAVAAMFGDQIIDNVPLS